MLEGVEARHVEIKRLEEDIVQLNQMFIDLGIMIEDQVYIQYVHDTHLDQY